MQHIAMIVCTQKDLFFVSDFRWALSGNFLVNARKILRVIEAYTVCYLGNRQFGFFQQFCRSLYSHPTNNFRGNRTVCAFYP